MRSLLAPLRSPCIVELGARCGEDEPVLSSLCSETAHYVMVEPDAWNCQHIIDKGLHQNRWLIVGCVGHVDGYTKFHPSLSDDGVTRGSGSWREPLRHQQCIAGVKFPAHMETVVPCFTLDTIFERQWLTKIDLLWVDIQGAEREMILGGTEALSHTRYCFMETETRELYQGMALKQELLDMMRQRGWVIRKDFGENVLFGNPGFMERGPR
jgi:FkbM family methyltransferase